MVNGINGDRAFGDQIRKYGDQLREYSDEIRKHGGQLRQQEAELPPPFLLAAEIESYLTDDQRQRAVLLVDQFEEIFTQTTDPFIRHIFIQLLTTAASAENSRVIVLLAMRSDFFSHCASHDELRALINREQQLVGRMAAPDLAKAIAMPAIKVGAEIDPALVSQIMEDMKGEPGALPLMSFALRDLFAAEKSAKGKPMDLTLPEYRDRGGIESALERHANKVFARFSLEEQDVAKGIFYKLIAVGQGQVDTRRTATFAELIPAGGEAATVQKIVAALAEEGVRLITTSGREIEAALGESGDGGQLEAGSGGQTENGETQTTISIAHEKLIDAWPWLRQLVDENRESIKLQTSISQDAQGWQEADREDSYLYRGGRLLQIEEWRAQERPQLDQLSEDFINASVGRREAEKAEKEAARQQKIKEAEERAQEQEQAAADLRRRLYTVVGALAVAVAASGLAIFFGIDANQSANLAQIREGEAGQALATATVAQGEAEEALAIATVAQGEAQIQQGTAEMALETSVASEATSEVRLTRVAEANATAEAERQEAARQARVALGQSLAALSTIAEEPNGDIDLNLLLALESSHLFAENGGSSAWLLDQEMRDILARPDLLRLFSGHTDWVRSVAFHPDPERNLLASGSDDGTVRLWDLENPGGEPTILSGHTSSVYSVAFHPDPGRNLLASGSDDGTVRLWDLENPGGEPTILSGHTSSVYSVAFHPDPGRNLLASGSGDQTVRLWDLENPGAEPTILSGHTSPVLSVAFHPDPGRNLLAFGSSDGTVRLWDLENPGAEPTILSGHTSPVLSVAFHPDPGRNLLAFGSSDGTVRLWDLENPGAEPTILSGHTGWVYSVAFHPDPGRNLLASGSDDGTVRLWDLENPGGEPTILSGHTSPVLSVAFHPDPGRNLLASGSRDQTVRLWDLENPGAEPTILSGHTEPVSSVAFHPDPGRNLLASGSRDQTVRLWLTLDGLVQLACQQVSRNLTEAEWNLYVDDGVTYRPQCDFSDSAWEAAGKPFCLQHRPAEDCNWRRGVPVWVVPAQ